MKLYFCVPVLLCEGRPSPAATLLFIHTCLRQKKKMISGAAGCVKACWRLFFISSIVQMQTSRNSHCVDFVLLDGAEMYSAQSWCINLLISPLYYSYIKPQLQNEEVWNIVIVIWTMSCRRLRCAGNKEHYHSTGPNPSLIYQLRIL